jgi:hypothetical protein
VNDEILKQIFVVFKNMFVMFLDNDLWDSEQLYKAHVA